MAFDQFQEFRNLKRELVQHSAQRGEGIHGLSPYLQMHLELNLEHRQL